MTNQLWSCWHAEAERLEKGVLELKAKLDELEGIEIVMKDKVKDNNKLRAELEQTKARLDETTLEWHRLNQWCLKQSVELERLKKADLCLGCGAILDRIKPKKDREKKEG